MEFEYYAPHFSNEFSQDIQDYATADIFCHYIFVEIIGKQQYGYCTHCKNEFNTNTRLKHNLKFECPSCRMECTVKESWRGRKHMIDEAYFIYYEKSIVDPIVMVARGIYAVRVYTGNYKKVKTLYGTRAHYIFKMGESVMFKAFIWLSTNNTIRVGEPEKCNFNSLYRQYPAKKEECAVGCCFESIDNAVKGTPFQYSCYEKFEGHDGMVKYFEMYSKYPIIESLIKVGFLKQVESKVNGQHTCGAVNWRAKTIQKALRLDKHDIKELRESKQTLDCRFLKVYQMSKKDNSNLSLMEIKAIYDECYQLDYLYDVMKYSSMRKAILYLKKQMQSNYKINFNDALIDWKDYIKDCIDLEKDLKNNRVLFPKDLHKAHQATTKLLKVKESEILNKKIAERAKSLEYFYFEYEGLMIRPAVSHKELIKEGDTLSHCVASRYSDSYANGKTNIFFIRKLDAPEKPFYTVEIKNYEVIQVRGKGNKAATEDVEKFLEAFKKSKLNKKSKNKSRIEIPA